MPSESPDAPNAQKPSDAKLKPNAKELLNVKLDRDTIEKVRGKLMKTFLGRSNYSGGHKGNKIVRDALENYLNIKETEEARVDKKLDKIVAEFEAANMTWQKTAQGLAELKSHQQKIEQELQEIKMLMLKMSEKIGSQPSPKGNGQQSTQEE